jgi:hypothetical protein
MPKLPECPRFSEFSFEAVDTMAIFIWVVALIVIGLQFFPRWLRIDEAMIAIGTLKYRPDGGVFGLAKGSTSIG